MFWDHPIVSVGLARYFYYLLFIWLIRHIFKISLPTGPTTASWPSWLRYRSKYCDSNNGGGDIIQPDSTTPISLSQCQQACEANSLCEGIVVRGFPTTQAHEAAFVGHCMKIANLKLSECSASLETDVLLARSGGKAWRFPRGNTYLKTSHTSMFQRKCAWLRMDPNLTMFAFFHSHSRASHTMNVLMQGEFHNSILIKTLKKWIVRELHVDGKFYWSLITKLWMLMDFL